MMSAICSPGIHKTFTSKEPLVVIWCANERYAPGLELGVRSLIGLRRVSFPLEIVIVDAGLEISTLNRIGRFVESGKDLKLKVIQAPLERFREMVFHRYHISAYVRLAIPDLVARQYALYLDSDLLPMSDLLHRDCLPQSASHPITAVSDWETRSLPDDSAAIALAYGVSECADYFNSGVIGMNLGVLRDESFTQKACELLAKLGQQARFADQSALNALMAERWEKMPSIWNTPAWAFDEQEDNSPPGILHYTNSAPWLQRHYRPSQALFERAARELGVVLPKPEKGLLRTMPAAVGKWLVAPARVVWHGLRSARASRKGDAKMTAGERHIMRHWWRYFAGGPARVLRYHRRIREIKSPDFRIFDRS
jgi:lipopolysaccharide biosynthesis glycosyltransferase